MKDELWMAFEKILDDEARRVISVIKKIYNTKRLNYGHASFIRSLVDEKAKYYAYDIQLRVYNFWDRKMIFSSDIDANKYYLLKYIEWCKSYSSGKDHHKAAKEIATKLIKYNNKNNKSLLELVAYYMPYSFPDHHDSVDSRAVVLLLQNEIHNKGYKVVSLTPFKIIKI